MSFFQRSWIKKGQQWIIFQVRALSSIQCFDTGKKRSVGGVLISLQYITEPTTTTTTTILWPFFRDHPGEPVPEETFWTLWCKGRLTEADTLTIQLGASPSGLTSAQLHHRPIPFYRLDALPAAQPTVSKH